MKITENNNNEHLYHIIFTLFCVSPFFPTPFFTHHRLGCTNYNAVGVLLFSNTFVLMKINFLIIFFIPFKLKWMSNNSNIWIVFDKYWNCILLLKFNICLHLKSSDTEKVEFYMPSENHGWQLFLYRWCVHQQSEKNRLSVNFETIGCFFTASRLFLDGVFNGDR